MKPKLVATLAALFAAIVLPLSTAGRTRKTTTPAEVAPATLASEGAGLIKAIEADTCAVHHDADALVSFDRTLHLDVRVHTATLN